MKYLTTLKVVLCCLLLTNLSFSQLFPVSKKLSPYEFKWGYINAQGKLYAPYDYQFAMDFSDSMGCVAKYVNDEYAYGYLNRFGRVEIDFKYKEANSFKNGYALVQKSDKSMIIDKKGKEYTVDNLWFHTRNFVSDGLVIILSNSKKGFSDLNNKVVIPAEFEILTPFSDGFAVAMNNKKVILIERNGKQHPTEYVDAMKFVNGLMPVKNAEGKWGVINKKLELVIGFSYNYIDEFSGGFAGFENQNGKWGLMNEKGEIVVVPAYKDLAQFSEGRILALNEDGTTSILDEKFKEVKRLDKMHEFSSRSKYSDGLCYQSKIVYDKNHKEENIRNYGGYANVYLDKSGNVLWQSEVYYACFPENVLVKMADCSTKVIQDVRVGDKILSYDEENRKNKETTVTQVEIHEGQFEIYELSVVSPNLLTANLNTEIPKKTIQIQATPNHPIWTNEGLKKMQEIQVGDEVFLWDDETQGFESHVVQKNELISKVEKVYNLKTTANYYVVNSVLVMMK